VGSTQGVNHYAALSGLNILNAALHPTPAPSSVAQTLRTSGMPTAENTGHYRCHEKAYRKAGNKKRQYRGHSTGAHTGHRPLAGFSMQIQQGSTNDDVHAFEGRGKEICRRST